MAKITDFHQFFGSQFTDVAEPSGSPCLLVQPASGDRRRDLVEKLYPAFLTTRESLQIPNRDTEILSRLNALTQRVIS